MTVAQSIFFKDITQLSLKAATLQPNRFMTNQPASQAITLNNEVTRFLDDLHHPCRQEIEALRLAILQANNSLNENIKWNGPNYSIGPEDRITMRIHPPKQIQLIFHRGAKVREQPPTELIKDDSGLLIWKANDRAVATYKDMASIDTTKVALGKIVQDWINATS